MNIPFDTIYEDEDCWVGRYFESIGNKWILAVRISKWSLSKYKKYIKIFAELLLKYPEDYISLVRGEKEKKFNMLFGFKETGIILKDSEIVYEVLYVRI